MNTFTFRTCSTSILFGALAVVTFILSQAITSTYGRGTFLLLPLGIGFLSAVTIKPEQRDFFKCLLVALAALLISCVVVILLGLEGALSLMMVTPLAIFMCGLGVSLALVFRSFRVSRAPIIGAALALCCGVVVLDSISARTVPLLTVHTSVLIEGSPSEIWKQVIEFPPIPQPTEWLFKTGIAFPTEARIDGEGPSALRHCIFSTGEFIEPIEIWNPPNLLRFSVNSVPPPLKEISPWSTIQSKYLGGYLKSKRGEFKIVSLDSQRVRLEATTWYENHLWPVTYWEPITRYIINRIHSRVLSHIKTNVESAGI